MATKTTKKVVKPSYDSLVKLVKKYENQLAKKVKIAAVSEHDVNIYQQLFNVTNISHLPVFLPFTG